jgi:dTDP-4-amino-4,6-dideoxygalactose transaminase
VHFAGLPMDMDALYALARKHQLRVIEDAAHAIGTRWRGRNLGAQGDIVVFSFHPNKNMTTIEGGAVVADDPAELKILELERWHGLERFPDGNAEVVLPGGKSNLTDVAAAVGLGQLARLEEFNARRRQLVARYFATLRTDPAVRLPERGNDDHSWHIFAPLLPLDQLKISRGEFIAQMKARGIGVAVHYPAIHTFQYYRGLGYHDGQFPNTERIGRETVSLPLFPRMKDTDVDRVCEAVAAILKDNRR